MKCDLNECDFQVNGKEFKIKFTEVYSDIAKEKKKQ